VEKILLFYCLTIIAGFFLSILVFLFINKWLEKNIITPPLQKPEGFRVKASEGEDVVLYPVGA
jgi:hypothetical protein